MDPELHKKYIGVDNKLILDNLVKLSDAGARIYIRIPTIKEVNGNVQNMEDTIHFLKKHGIHPAQVNLLPYHNTGRVNIRSWVWNTRELIYMHRKKKRWKVL